MREKKTEMKNILCDQCCEESEYDRSEWATFGDSYGEELIRIFVCKNGHEQEIREEKISEEEF